MDYKKIIDYIMFDCKDKNEVEEYIVSLATSVKLSVLEGSEYPLFIEYASIYAKVREQLEIHPLGEEIFNCEDGKTYDSSIVSANLEYTAMRLAAHLTQYINTPINKYNY